jgi:hypothetical protein
MIKSAIITIISIKNVSIIYRNCYTSSNYYLVELRFTPKLNHDITYITEKHLVT